MDPATLLLLAEKDKKIASLTKAYVELTDKYNKLTDDHTELSRENASLNKETVRLLDSNSPSNSPSHTVSDTSTLHPNTAATTPSPPAPATTEEETAWGSQSPSYDPAWATGQESCSTLSNDGNKTTNKRKVFKASWKNKCSAVGTFFNGILTKLSDPSTYTIQRKQNPADPSHNWQQDPANPSDGWPGESAPTAWDQSATTGWDQAPGPGAVKEEPKWRSLKQPRKTTSWLHGRWWCHADLLRPKKLERILGQHALVPITRLDDGDWVQSGLRDVRVDDKYLFQLATHGKEIAQRVVYDHACENHQSLRDELWPAGPHQVKLEVVAMNDAVGSDTSFFEWGENDPRKAQDLLLYKVVNLRHMVAHWDHLRGRKTAQFIATHLENVQKFAITMGNEKCAMEARMLRDELLQAVKDTVPEVEELDRVADLEELSPTYEARQFEIHHVQMFREIEESKRWEEPEELGLPEVIYRAAEAWARRRDEAWTIQEQEDEEEAKKEDAKIRRRNSFGGRTVVFDGGAEFKRRRNSCT